MEHDKELKIGINENKNARPLDKTSHGSIGASVGNNRQEILITATTQGFDEAIEKEDRLRFILKDIKDMVDSIDFPDVEMKVGDVSAKVNGNIAVEPATLWNKWQELKRILDVNTFDELPVDSEWVEKVQGIFKEFECELMSSMAEPIMPITGNKFDTVLFDDINNDGIDKNKYVLAPKAIIEQADKI